MLRKSISESSSSTVAIVGKPNVGKSTLFNRLVSSKEAIVHDQPGVTRDRHYGIVEWNRRSFRLIDTGGYAVKPKSDLAAQMKKQVEIAFTEADLVLWVVDGREEISSEDREIGIKLRRIGKPVLLVVNKIDHSMQEPFVSSFYELGIEKIFPVSAEHGRGVGELLEEAVSSFKAHLVENREANPIYISILGRPNVGKSTLLNRLFGAPRAIVHNAPGTTRDPLSILIQREGAIFEFIDTAGIRKKSDAEGKVEKVSVLKASRSLERSDVALLLIDAREGLTSQDRKIALRILEAYKPFLILRNKSDLVTPLLPGSPGNQRFPGVEAPLAGSGWASSRQGRGDLGPFSFVPSFSISAKTGQGLSRLFREIKKIDQEGKKRVSTGELNRFFRQIVAAHPPPLISGKSINLFYMAQTGEAPPRFVVLANHPALIPETYRRYLIHKLRDHFFFRGVPIQLQFKGRRKKRFHK